MAFESVVAVVPFQTQFSKKTTIMACTFLTAMVVLFGVEPTILSQTIFLVMNIAHNTGFRSPPGESSFY